MVRCVDSDPELGGNPKMNNENNSPKVIQKTPIYFGSFQSNLFERTQSSIPTSYKLFLLIKLVFTVS